MSDATLNLSAAQSGNPGNDSKKTIIAAAATGVAGAALGVVGTRIAEGLADAEIEEIEESAAAATAAPQAAAAQNTAPAAEPTNPAEAVDPVNPAATAEPTNPATTAEPANPAAQAQPVNEPAVEDPTEVANAIIAEEQIDPADIDMADVITFDEIGTVYTLEGENFTAATFHDNYGNDLMMVDVDGDNVFDVITDGEGNLLVDDQGNFLSAGDVTVDDVETQLAGGDKYVASNQYDIDNDPTLSPESIQDDILC